MRWCIGLIAVALSTAAFAKSGTLTANGQTADETCRSGEANVSTTGTSFGSGTVKIQYFHDVNGWTDLPDASYTAAFVKRVLFGGRVTLRLDLATATGPSIPWQINCK